jgi:hypothetical protein
MRNVEHTIFLSEPLEAVLALIEGVVDQWRELADTHEDWEFSLICIVEMSDAFLAQRQFPVLTSPRAITCMALCLFEHK